MCWSEQEMDDGSNAKKFAGSHPPLKEGSIKPALTRHERIGRIFRTTPAPLPVTGVLFCAHRWFCAGFCFARDRKELAGALESMKQLLAVRV